MKLLKENHKGMVLILVFIVMTTLTAIVTAYTYLTSTRARVSGYNTDSFKALWLAEAGLAQVIYNLKMVPGYATFPTTGALAGGTYSVSKNGNIYTSTGTMNAAVRVVRQTIVLATAPSQGGYGLTPGSVTLGKDWTEID